MANLQKMSSKSEIWYPSLFVINTKSLWSLFILNSSCWENRDTGCHTPVQEAAIHATHLYRRILYIPHISTGGCFTRSHVWHESCCCWSLLIFLPGSCDLCRTCGCFTSHSSVLYTASLHTQVYYILLHSTLKYTLYFFTSHSSVLYTASLHTQVYSILLHFTLKCNLYCFAPHSVYSTASPLTQVYSILPSQMALIRLIQSDKYVDALGLGYGLLG